MARVTSKIDFVGKLGGMSIYDSRYGKLIRTIGKVNKKKLKNDPKQALKRAANKEFGYASRVGKLMRWGVEHGVVLAEVGTTNTRLSGLIRIAGMEDNVHNVGDRKLVPYNIGMLRGFNWAEDAKVSAMLRTPYIVQVDTNTNTATLDINELVPARDLRLSGGATHAEIRLVLMSVDYERDKFKAASVGCELIELDGDAEMSVNLSCTLEEVVGDILMAGIGIQRHDEVDGKIVLLKGGAGFEIGEVGVRG